MKVVPCLLVTFYVTNPQLVKRAKAENAQKDFFTLLKSKGDVKPTSEWKEVSVLKYSSSLRLTVFSIFLDKTETGS